MTCFLCGFNTDSPAPKCKYVRCRICSEVAMVEVEIKLAVANLQRLLTKRRDLRSEQNNAHDIMRQLPLELKSRIFELVLSTRTRDEWDDFRGFRRGKTPSFLTSICRNWRDIALSNPLLWSTIPILLGTPSTFDHGWVNFVYNWIQRSRNLPLKISIAVYECSEDDLEDELEGQLNNVLHVMVQCPNKWQCLSLNIPLSLLDIFQGGDNEFKSHLLTVKTFQLRLTDDWYHVDLPVEPTMSPEKIKIYDMSFKLLPISWNHLTSAEVNSWRLEEITHLIQHASQMIYCSISWPRRKSEGFALSPITHRMLQTLCLRYNEYDTPMLLDFFTFPSLRAIETDIGVVALLPSLMRRSSCPLTRVTILEVVELTSDLQPLPGVTNLVIEKEHDDAMLRALLLEGYLPDLRHLTLPLNSFIILLETGVISMMLDRNQPRPDVVPLDNIFVVDRQGVDPLWDSDLADQLKAFRLSLTLREDGFKVSMPEVQKGDKDS